MICPDTSIWVAAFRDAECHEAGILEELLDDDAVALAIPVKVEILSGAGKRSRPRLRRALSALPSWIPDSNTWNRIDDWVDRAGAAGERFGFADLLIAAIASERGAQLWSLDADFRRMAGLDFVDLFEPPAAPAGRA